jgi:hypothetical protein
MDAESTWPGVPRAVRLPEIAWRGDGCCVGSPLDGFAVEGQTCHDDCCR